MSELDNYLEKVIEIQNDYHKKVPKEDRDHNIATAREPIRFVDGKGRKALVALFRTQGCSWYFKTGGCFMCSYNVKKKTEKFTTQELINQIKYLEQKYDLNNYELIYSYFSSSLDPAESSKEAREYLYKTFERYPNLEYVFLQARSEHVTKPILDEVKELLSNKKIFVQIGLETTNPFISEYLIHKGFDFDDVKKNHELLKEYGFKTAVFLLFKPPFLTEREAIDDMIKSIRECLDVGIDDITMMCNHVGKYSVTELLYKMKKYKPAWLWSVIEILKQFTPEEHKKIYASGFEISSQSADLPHNCENCSEEVMQKLTEFKETRDISVFDGLDCECKKQWQEELEKGSRPLKERLLDDYKELIGFYNKNIR